MRYADIQRLREDDSARVAAGHSSVGLNIYGEPIVDAAHMIPCACGARCAVKIEGDVPPCGGIVTVLNPRALERIHLCAVHLIICVEAEEPERVAADLARRRAAAVAEAEAMAIHRRPQPQPAEVIAAIETGIQGTYNTADRSATLLHVACTALSYVAALSEVLRVPGVGMEQVQDQLAELAGLFGLAEGVARVAPRTLAGTRAVELAAKLRRAREILADPGRATREAGE